MPDFSPDAIRGSDGEGIPSINSDEPAQIKQDNIARDKDTIELAASAQAVFILLATAPQLVPPVGIEDGGSAADGVQLNAREMALEIDKIGSSIQEKYSENQEQVKELISTAIEDEIKRGNPRAILPFDHVMDIAKNFNEFRGIGRSDVHAVAPVVVMYSMVSNDAAIAVRDPTVDAEVRRGMILEGSLETAKMYLPQKTREDIGSMILMEMIALQYFALMHGIGAMMDDAGTVDPHEETGGKQEQQFQIALFYAMGVLTSLGIRVNSEGMEKTGPDIIQQYLQETFSHLVNTDPSYAGRSPDELASLYSPLFRAALLMPAYAALIQAEEQFANSYDFAVGFDAYVYQALSMSKPEADASITDQLGWEIAEAYRGLSEQLVGGFNQIRQEIRAAGADSPLFALMQTLSEVYKNPQLGMNAPINRGGA
ncbi:MAG: hypothetical protein CMO81_12390 [Waddliaceae bacterium]|nr:hypothetical protein [Waddliaceae bacterium]